ncbi:SURF1 family protein [Mycetocola sp. JXN-3]|uniref:SURF1 family cytochrome oxidase biogenesis protein n=1 Tax=Mycetocola sp. JXN-3 TaxID=2116510 RepID=UPI00165D0156|nr:SURF1 family protein [Mycetocola sp. JXN-3]
MNRWRFVFEKRWFAYLGVAIVFAIACVLLSNWQLDRRGEREDEIARVAKNFDATPVQIDQALPSESAFNINDRWLPVTMHGRYEEDRQILVRNRPYDGSPGYEILTPLRLDNGKVFLVNRGWVPQGNNAERPDHVPAPPSGEVTVVARLKASEDTIRGRGAPSGQLATVNLPEAETILKERIYTGAYGLLDTEDPAPSEQRPAAVKKPEPDEGPHLSYAFQWILFALMGFTFLGWAVREEYRRVNSDDPAEKVRAAKRAAKRASKLTDADVEDAEVEDVRIHAER